MIAGRAFLLTSGVGLISSLLLYPPSGLAFDTAGMSQTSVPPPTAAAQREQKIATFDNDSLDKMFGKERTAAKSRSATAAGSQPDSLNIAPNESLLRGIRRGTKARQAAALRLAEKGRLLLQKKEYRRSVAQLEQALSLDANPVIYYYLAKGHYYLGDSDRASGFLAAAEAGLVPDAWWTGEFVALRTAISSMPVAQQPAVRQNVSWASQY